MPEIIQNILDMNLEAWDCINFIGENNKETRYCVLWRLWWPTVPWWEDRTEYYYIVNWLNIFTRPNDTAKKLWNDPEFCKKNSISIEKDRYEILIWPKHIDPPIER